MNTSLIFLFTLPLLNPNILNNKLFIILTLLTSLTIFLLTQTLTNHIKTRRDYPTNEPFQLPYMKELHQIKTQASHAIKTGKKQQGLTIWNNNSPLYCITKTTLKHKITPHPRKKQLTYNNNNINTWLLKTYYTITNPQTNTITNPTIIIIDTTNHNDNKTRIIETNLPNSPRTIRFAIIPNKIIQQHESPKQTKKHPTKYNLDTLIKKLNEETQQPPLNTKKQKKLDILFTTQNSWEIK